MPLTLYGYWRSSAAYRLRIALNLKGQAYDQVSINLKNGEQTSEAWLAKQPQGLVPLLEDGDKRCTLAMPGWMARLPWSLAAMPALARLLPMTLPGEEPR